MRLVPQRLGMTVARKVLTVKRNSPHIFFAGGVAGVVGSAFLACRATLKLEEKLDGIKTEMDAVTPVTTPVEGGGYVPDQEQIKAFGQVCIKSGVVLGRLYGPAVVLGGVSIAALTGSHIQLTKRNTALTVTLAAITKAYDEYRVRVQQVVGKEAELDIYRDVKVESVMVDGKKKAVKVVNGTEYSPYARFFDETSREWVKDAEMNLYFLQCQQTYANHQLRARGHIFLNEVYDSLGMERSAAGQVVGWVINGEGDGYVDFGIYEARSNRFVNNLEPRIILDFNVDGPVHHLLGDAPLQIVRHTPVAGE